MYDADSEGLRFPILSGMTRSNADFTQVINHRLAHGSFRRGEPYVPEPKPVFIERARPLKQDDLEKPMVDTRFHNNEINQASNRRRSYSEAFVMLAVEQLHAGKTVKQVAEALGVNSEVISRINNRSTSIAINCWMRINQKES